jgi:radical SAM superfamily enzyme YgiQ (UPF0313 family)
MLESKRILFIIPPFGPIENYLFKTPGQKKTVLTLPYGVLSIISYINRNIKHDIRILDCNKIILENIENDNIENVINSKIKSEVLDMQPDFICISALFNTSFSHIKIVRDIKTYYKYCFIAVGGGLATNMYEKLLEDFPEIDAICYGEGELPFSKILESKFIEDVSSLSPAWVTKSSLKRNQSPQYDFVENLDNIPPIQLEYLDYKKYNCRSYINKESVNKVEISIHTSRGCPFNCVFCANGKLHGKKVRTMSKEKVIETIKYYKEKYGLTLLLVEDDHFLYNKKRALDILQFIADNNINTEFPNGLSVYQIDDEVARMLNVAKVKLVTLAIESGSDYVLKEVIDKPLTTKKIIDAVANLKKYDIRIHAFLVIGIPGETDEHRKESLDFLVKLGIDWVYIFIATPIVGSRLYEICKKNNYIDDNFGNHIVTKGNITAPGIDPKKMEDYAYYMHVVINALENINMKQGKYDIVEEYFLRVLNSYPNEAVAHFVLFNVYKNKGNLYKCGLHFHKYLVNYNDYIDKYKNNKEWKKLIEEVFIR